MAMNEHNYREVSLKLIPTGLAWRKATEGTLGKLLGGLANTWAKIDADGEKALSEMNPQWAETMLPEWENLLGLPECGLTGQTLKERQDAAGTKWHFKGSLNYKFYEAWMLKGYGYKIKIVERFPHHCLRGCDYPLWDYEYKWRVDVYVEETSPYRYFNVQDKANDPLRFGQTSILECLLNKYKPAHIHFIFHYDTTINDKE